MKARILRFMPLAILAACPLVGLAYTNAETNHLVWALLKRARVHLDNVANPDEVRIVPDFSNPDVFFAMQTDVPWTRVEKETAFNAFVESMWTMDFGPNSQIGDVDVPNPISAVYQCGEMNYTNAVPAIRRLALNPTLEDVHRRKVVDTCIALGPVDDEMTRFVEVFMTNRTDYTWRDRRVAFSYARKVIVAGVSNLVPRAVSNRAAMMFYNARVIDDWEYATSLDTFLAAYDSIYAVSSNRLDFITTALANTNMPGHVDLPTVRTRFIAITNELHSLEQPLSEWNPMGGE